jgi:hypothetical protein
MKFNQNEFETTIIASKKSISKEGALEPKSEEKNSYNSIQFDSFDERDNICQSSLNLKVSNKAKSCKKISIMIDGEFA